MNVSWVFVHDPDLEGSREGSSLTARCTEGTRVMGGKRGPSMFLNEKQTISEHKDFKSVVPWLPALSK